MSAQRFGCHNANSPPAGVTTTLRQPAGPEVDERTGHVDVDPRVSSILRPDIELEKAA